MDFTFLKASGEVAFFRSDAEEASWTQEELSLRCTFPYIPEMVIERGMVILFQDPATDAWQAFNIRQCVIMPGAYYQQITGEDIAITELSACLIQDKIEMTDISVISALSQILTGTGWNVGTTVSSVSSGDISRGSVWEAVSTVTQNWNVYIMPRVTVGPDGITGRYLDIISTQGVDRGLRLAIDKNMSDPCVTYDDSELFTALYGYGGTYSEGSGSSKATLEYNFSSVSWAKTPDHPAKPAGQRYIEYPEMTALYGLNGRPRFGYYQNTDINDPNVLLEKTWETLKEVCKPKISISGTVRDLKRMGYADIPLRLHDMAVIELEPVGLLFYKQVTRLTVDLLDPSKNTPEIGDYIPNIIYINRETESFATGGSKGSGKNKNRTKIDLINSEFRTDIYDNGRQVGMLAVQVDEHGNILNQAGMEIDPETGVLIYAEGKDNMIGSMFHVQKNMIESEVHNREQEGAELSSRITQTANAISLEVSERKSADAGLSGRITVEASKITQIVEAVGEDGQVTAASIVLAINDAGESEAHIDANKVYIGDDKSTTVIAGKCELSDVTAQYIAGKIATLSVLNVAAISATGNISTSNGYIMAPYYYMGVSGNAVNMASAVRLMQIVQSGNTYTLQKQDFDDDDWVDVGSFSRATTLTGAWSGGRFTASASPQGNSFWTELVQGTASRDGGTITIPVEAIDQDSGGTQYSTGRNVYVTLNTMTITRAPAYKNSSGNYEYYGKLYYYDATSNVYRAASTSDQYWYYSNKNRSGTNTVLYD